MLTQGHVKKTHGFASLVEIQTRCANLKLICKLEAKNSGVDERSAFVSPKARSFTWPGPVKMQLLKWVPESKSG